MKSILVLLAALSLSACVPATIPSESRPSVGSVNVVQQTNACTVQSVRRVQLNDPYMRPTNSRSRVPQMAPQQQMGATLGGLAGALIGNELGGRDAALVGALVGSMAGNHIGYQRDMAAPYSQGLEVVAQTARGTFVIVQGNNPSDRPLYPGQSCLITGTHGRDARVIGL